MKTLVRRVCIITSFSIVVLVTLYEFGGVSMSAPPTVDVKACSSNVDIVIAARAQIGVTTNYVADYRKIDYPNGDIPRGEGVCSDVVVRALRDARKIDLQELMHLDMSANFSKYPRKRKWLLGWPDSNIDHRRVLNQECFFARQGWAVPVTTNRDDYLPGDLVTCRVYGLPPSWLSAIERHVTAHHLSSITLAAGHRRKMHFSVFN